MANQRWAVNRHEGQLASGVSVQESLQGDWQYLPQGDKRSPPINELLPESKIEENTRQPQKLSKERSQNGAEAAADKREL